MCNKHVGIELPIEEVGSPLVIPNADVIGHVHRMELVTGIVLNPKLDITRGHVVSCRLDTHGPS